MYKIVLTSVITPGKSEEVLAEAAGGPSSLYTVQYSHNPIEIWTLATMNVKAVFYISREASLRVIKQ
jgi:hypothetical protein